MTANGTGPERLYLLQLGNGSIPFGEYVMEMSLGCYFVQMADGKRVLIDTGLPEDVTLDNFPPLAMQPNVVAQLATLGVQPDDVDIVVSTHFDVDHAGFHDAFPNAEHVVQRQHYALARADHPRFNPARKHWDHAALRYRLLDGDTELLPGLKLIATSGHTTGHQSVLVHLPQSGPVLLAIDAVPLARLFTPERPATPVDEDEEQARASTQKLLDLTARADVSLVVFGHDGEQWATLKRAPEWYG